MSNSQQSSGAIEPIFSTRTLVPTVQRIGEKAVEVTYLGVNVAGEPTWILWDAKDPFMIGMLSQGKMGYTFEQRTTMGPMVHSNLSTHSVQRMLGSGN